MENQFLSKVEIAGSGTKIGNEAYQRLNSTYGTSDGKNTCHMKENSLSAFTVNDNRNFINHGAVEGENKLCNGEPNLSETDFEDDSDKQDEQIFKSEEFEDDSEMNYQSVKCCKSKCRSISVDGIDNLKEISHCNNTTVYTVQSPSKEMNISQSPFKDVNKFQSSLKYVKRLSLGRIPKTSRCFSCQKNVKEDHFSEHMFFGAVKCSKCNSDFRNCQIFAAWSEEYALGYVKCEHSFVFVNDPLVYIIESLSLGEAEHGLGNEELLSALEKYIYKIRSLESKFPWKYAIRKCKDHIALQKFIIRCTFNNAQNDLDLKGSRNVSQYKETEYLDNTEPDSQVSSPISRGVEEVEDKGKDYFTLIERKRFSELTSKGKSNNSRDFVHEEHSQNTEEFSTPKRAEMICSQFPHGIYDEDAHHQLLNDSQVSCMIGTSKDLDLEESLPNQIGFKTGTNKELDLEEPLPNQIGLKTGSREISTPSALEYDKMSNRTKDKVCSKRRKKKQNSSTKNTFLKIDTYMSVKMIEQPSDGFYFITQSPIEECPNCYCILCPSRSTVNCKTFLITFICPDCDLVIYIANDDTIILTEEVGNSVGGLSSESVPCHSETCVKESVSY